MEDTINIVYDDLSVSGNDSISNLSEENGYSSVSSSDNEMDILELQTEETSQTFNVTDLKIAFSESLNDYFSNECISVVQTDEGLNKSISKFSLSDICLVFILMILIAQSILKIIGGKAWNK